MVPGTSKATSTSVTSMMPDPRMARLACSRTAFQRHHTMAPTATPTTKITPRRRDIDDRSPAA
jgi:hypothetical protein